MGRGRGLRALDVSRRLLTTMRACCCERPPHAGHLTLWLHVGTAVLGLLMQPSRRVVGQCPLPALSWRAHRAEIELLIVLDLMLKGWTQDQLN